MRMIVALAAALLLMGAAPIDRWLVEDGTDTGLTNGATDGGVVLVYGFSTGEVVRLRPAPCVAGVCTRVAPDAGSEGISLTDVASVRVMVCAPPAQLLSGNGTLEAWTWCPILQEPGDIVAKNLSVTRTDHCQAFAVELNGMAGDGVRLTYRAVGVGVNGTDGGWLRVSTAACKMGRKGGCAP